MDVLSASELRQLLSAAADIAGSTDLDEFAEAVVASAARLVPSDIAAFNLVDRSTPRVDSRSDPPGLFSPGLLEVFAEHMHEHPGIAYASRTGDFATRRISDFQRFSEFERTGLYQRFFRAFELRYQLYIAFPLESGVIIGISGSRCAKDFDEHERQLLDALRPHVVNAHRGLAAQARAEALLSSLNAGLHDATGTAFVILEADGRIAFSTERARRLLHACFDWTDERRLPAAFPALDPAPGPRDTLVVRRSDAQLSLRRIRAGQPHAPIDLLILDAMREAPSLDRLRRLGLTRREGEILTYVARGALDKEIGNLLGISRRTVEKHLEHAYDKLGVRTRAGAVAKALEE